MRIALLYSEEILYFDKKLRDRLTGIMIVVGLDFIVANTIHSCLTHSPQPR